MPRLSPPLPPLPLAARLAGLARLPRVQARARVSGLASFVLLGSTLTLAACTSIPKGRSAIDDVTVLGAKALDPSAVEDKLATGATEKFLGLFRGVVYDYEVYDPSVLQRDMARVERYYRGQGFLEAHARAGRVLQVAPSHVQVEILVEEGPPVLNRDLVVEGLLTLPGDVVIAVQAAADARLTKGHRFSEDDYKTAKDELKRALTDRGYAYATVDADATIDLPTHSADYHFKLTPGPKCTFGAITIVGLDPDNDGPRPQEIDEAPLRRAINITDGEPFSSADIASATQALLDLEVFSAVNIQPQLPEPPPEHPVIPLKVSVEPTRLRTVRFGGGLEFDEIKTDVHLLAGWEDHNFLGGLRDFSVDVQPGVVLYPLRISTIQVPTNPLPEVRTKIQFRQPSFLEAHTSAFVKPEFNVYPFLVNPNPEPNDPVVGYIEAKGSIGIDRPFLKKLYVSLAYNAQLEDPFNYVFSQQTLPPVVVLAYPQLVTRLDLRDDPTHPHKGVYLSNDFQVANAIFGSRVNDVREQPELRGYVPLSKRVTLALRASVGFLFPENYQVAKYLPNENTSDANRTLDIEETYFRGFSSGGPTTNRGYPVRGVAPYGNVPFLLPQTGAAQVANSCVPGPNNPRAQTVECALPIAGLTLWEASVEVRFQVSGPFSTALFCDASDVSPYQVDFRFNHPHLSCGGGLRIDTPVGPIRLDLAYRIQPLQVIGYPNEVAAANANAENGLPPQLFNGVPLALAFGIGEAY